MAKSMPAKKSKKSSPALGTHWDEFDRVFENFRKDMEKSFMSFSSFKMPSFPQVPETSCDVIDEGNHFRVKMDMPGLKKNEIKLNVTDNAIEISGEHKEEAEEKKKNYLRKERSQSSIYRTVPLSEKVISGKTKAKLTDGVLTITLPKLKPTPVPKKKSVSIQ